MNRAALVLAFVAVTACSSGGANIPRPEIQLVQLYAPTDLAYARGHNTITAEFGFRITNRAAEPITLRRVDLETTGDGGYYLRRENRPFERQIGPGESAEEKISALAYFRTTLSGAASNEPVTLRATFHFDSPQGSFRQVVLRNIPQFSEGPR